MKNIEILKKTYEALFDAESHLNYCNYGESWERECAFNQNLPEKIDDSLEGILTLIHKFDKDYEYKQ